MFNPLKRFFGRSNRQPERKQTSTASASRPAFKTVPVRSVTPRSVEPAFTPASPPGPAPDLNAEDISIPLQSVLDALPPELKSCVVPMDLQGATLTVALRKVLTQLPTGVVKLSFGVLRGAAPQLFTVGEELDQQEIELPLNELLVRIHPSLLTKSPNQKAAVDTDKMENPFIPAETPASPSRAVSTQPVRGPMRVPLTRAVPAVTAPAVATSSPASPADETISVPLASLAASWPGVVRAEIAQLNSAEAQVALPEPLVLAGMKQGKVTFSWQAIRGWINPPPPPAISKHDSTPLDLPLEVIMPLFVSRLKQSPKTQPRVVVDETIPALFGPAVTPGVPATAGNNGSSESAASTEVPASKPKTPGTDFKNRYLSPTDVVTSATNLDGVVGALVVLPEGLLVAAKLMTDQDADALAAFLARAFGRVNQCAEEAQVGELTDLKFTAKNIPWQIFRLHGVLFAALGRAGGTLPTPQLAALAGEFERKKRG